MLACAAVLAATLAVGCGGGSVSDLPDASPDASSDGLCIRALRAGGEFACALKADGTVWCWGDNDFAEMGQRGDLLQPTPTPVPGLGAVIAVAAGGAHACALVADGAVWCWGANDAGQLGDGTRTGEVCGNPGAPSACRFAPVRAELLCP